MPTGLKSSPDDFDLRMSEEARPFYEQVVDFLERVVDPMQKQFFKEADPMNRWGYTERQLELLEGAKDQAKAEEAMRGELSLIHISEPTRLR